MEARITGKIQIIFVASLFAFGFFVFSAYAQTAQELQSKIDQSNNQIQGLEAEITQYQNQLTSLSLQKNTLANALGELALTSKKLAVDIQVTQEKINTALLEKQQISQSIQNTSDTISIEEHTISRLIQETQGIDSTNLVTYLANPNASLGDMWREVDSILTIQSQLTSETKKLRDNKSSLEDHKKAVEENEKELEGLAADLKNQKKANDAVTSQKKQLLAQTKNSQASYAKLIKNREAK